jgi:hypothetical protein
MGHLSRALLLTASAVLVLSACGGNDAEPEAPTAPEPLAVQPSVAPGVEAQPPMVASPAPEGSQPVWIPPGTFACALGPGNPDFGCDAEPPQFAGAVNAAIDKVIAEQRNTVFPDGDITAKVRDEEAIHVAVARVLQAQGFCAGWDFIDLQVRDSNDFSEHYDLFDARGFFHQDPAKRVRSTCRPADFPLTAGERIYAMRVGFYGINCPAGVTRPNNSANRLPVGCLGLVTATPKNKFNDDVDRRAHGPYITWTLRQNRTIVAMRDDSEVPFNKALRAMDPGKFDLCATVQGKTGCLEGTVTAN